MTWQLDLGPRVFLYQLEFIRMGMFGGGQSEFLHHQRTSHICTTSPIDYHATNLTLHLTSRMEDVFALLIIFGTLQSETSFHNQDFMKLFQLYCSSFGRRISSLKMGSSIQLLEETMHLSAS